MTDQPSNAEIEAARNAIRHSSAGITLSNGDLRAALEAAAKVRGQPAPDDGWRDIATLDGRAWLSDGERVWLRTGRITDRAAKYWWPIVEPPPPEQGAKP